MKILLLKWPLKTSWGVPVVDLASKLQIHSSWLCTWGWSWILWTSVLCQVTRCGVLSQGCYGNRAGGHGLSFWFWSCPLSCCSCSPKGYPVALISVRSAVSLQIVTRGFCQSPSQLPRKCNTPKQFPDELASDPAGPQKVAHREFDQLLSEPLC